MKFLVDNQLPPALARFLETDLHVEATHVSDQGLCNASDAEVWAHASADGFVLISKDEDFVNLFAKAPTARLLWVRLGNCRRRFLLDLFRRMWPKIAGRFADGELFVELR